MARKIDKEWLLEQLALVFRYSDELVSLSEETGPPYNSKSVLKLAKLAAAVEIYTKIMPKQNVEMHYIDALAGAGVMELKRPNEYTLGSAIIAPAVAHEPFDHYHYIERNGTRADALRKRLQYVSEETRIDLEKNQWDVYQGDANVIVPDIMDSLVQKKENENHNGVSLFRFVDNEGRTIDWSTIQNMAQIWGDFLLTFPTKSMPRDVGVIGTEDSDARESGITEFFGTDAWKGCDDIEDYPQLYETRLGEVGYDKFTVRTRIRGSAKSRGSYYDVIWATRRTSNESPYKEGIEHIRNRIERSDGGVVNTFIEQFVRGNQASFDLYDSDGEVGHHGFNEFM